MAADLTDRMTQMRCATLILRYLSIGFLSLTLGASTVSAEDRKPNVLFIVSDDLNTYLGCYGDETVHTPNIDRLASRGVLFERAYCQFPVCGASRSSFMTGMRPDRTGVYDNGTHFRERLPDVVTLPQHFRNCGYFVARVGKIYHYGVPKAIGTDGKDDAASWDHRVNPCGRDKADEGRIFSLIKGQFGGTLSWLSADGTAEEQTDGLIATESIDLLNERGSRAQPLFLAVGFFRPHTPFVAPHRFFDAYAAKDMNPPFSPIGDRLDMSPLAFFHKPDQDAMSLRLKQQARQAYAAAITFMDEQVGRLMDALEKSGLIGNTVIVFTSDHGYHMGEHRYWQKESLFEESARVPLIISTPRMKTAGQRTRAICEMVDLYPTLSDLCGLPAPKDVDGVTLKRQLEDPESPGKSFALTQAVRYKGRWVSADRKMRSDAHGYSIRTENFRFTSWAEGHEGEELYDLTRNPGEFSNVVNELNYRKDVDRLRDLLDTQRRSRKP